MWDQRYATEDCVYGTHPNDFLADAVGALAPPGRVLCLAEGEGRNAVFLAEREVHEGHLHSGLGAVVQVVAVKPAFGGEGS
jgi:hypothetical protein